MPRFNTDIYNIHTSFFQYNNYKIIPFNKFLYKYKKNCCACGNVCVYFIHTEQANDRFLV